jgi:hypothetical protein
MAIAPGESPVCAVVTAGAPNSAAGRKRRSNHRRERGPRSAASRGMKWDLEGSR